MCVGLSLACGGFRLRVKYVSAGCGQPATTRQAWFLSSPFCLVPLCTRRRSRFTSSEIIHQVTLAQYPSSQKPTANPGIRPHPSLARASNQILRQPQKDRRVCWPRWLTSSLRCCFCADSHHQRCGAVQWVLLGNSACRIGVGATTKPSPGNQPGRVKPGSASRDHSFCLVFSHLPWNSATDPRLSLSRAPYPP